MEPGRSFVQWSPKELMIKSTELQKTNIFQISVVDIELWWVAAKVGYTLMLSLPLFDREKLFITNQVRCLDRVIILSISAWFNHVMWGIHHDKLFNPAYATKPKTIKKMQMEIHINQESQERERER